jgi:hypothetical protein
VGDENRRSFDGKPVHDDCIVAMLTCQPIPACWRRIDFLEGWGVGERMTREQRAEVSEICQRITRAQDDPVQFQRLVVELLGVLDRATPGGEVDSKPN